MENVILNLPPFIRVLYEELERRIGDALLIEDELIQKQEAIKVARESLYRLREAVLNEGFRGEDEEVFFFKSVKPLFLEPLIYYSEAYRIELQQPSTIEADKKAFLSKELQAIKIDLSKYKEFQYYYKSRATNLDSMLFRRGRISGIPLFPRMLPDHDPAFSTGYDYMIAHITAMERLTEYINRKLVLQWQAGPTAFVELIYSFYANRTFGDKQFKELMDAFGEAFGVKVNHYYKTKEEIRLRQNPTVYLDELRAGLRRQVDEDNEGT